MDRVLGSGVTGRSKAASERACRSRRRFAADLASTATFHGFAVGRRSFGRDSHGQHCSGAARASFRTQGSSYRRLDRLDEDEQVARVFAGWSSACMPCLAPQTTSSSASGQGSGPSQRQHKSKWHRLREVSPSLAAHDQGESGIGRCARLHRDGLCHTHHRRLSMDLQHEREGQHSRPGAAAPTGSWGYPSFPADPARLSLSSPNPPR